MTEEINNENKNKTLVVIIFTFFTMVAEILWGYLTNSMGLLADGYHMLCHGLALVLTYVAYVLTAKFANSKYFKKGCNKIGTLAAYTSSLFLGGMGIWIIIEAYFRFINPLNIKFSEAIFIAVIGLLVNFICIIIMDWGKKQDKKDYNFLAAYYHILADALTSLLAIGALLLGKFFNYVFLDSIIGILGGVLILKWAFDLIKSTVKILIDMECD